MAGFLGMSGTGSWAPAQSPKSWREMILYLYPNGSAPLTAVLSKLSEESTTDPEYNWWTKTLPTQKATLTAFGAQADGDTGAVSGTAAAGTVIYGTCAEADADQFREGHQALLRDTTDTAKDTNAKVVSVVKAGAASVIGFKLLEENNGLTDTILTTSGVALIIGNVNAEGASSPSAIGYDPVKYTNYTQIFRTPLQISITARATKLRTGDAYKELKREALELHSIEMEKAFIHGVKSETTGSTGLPERTTDGLINFIQTTVPGNVLDHTNDTDLAALTSFTSGASTWATTGEDFLDAALEQIFRYGSSEKVIFCGSGALLGIQRLAKLGGQIQLSPKSEAYGMKVVEWITPFGVVYLKTHPLFSYESNTRNWGLVVEPEKLKYRFIDDTKFSDVTPVGQDGTKEEFLTECGLELHHPESFGILKGIGLDNAA